MSKIGQLIIVLALSLPAAGQSFFAYNGDCAKGGQEVLVQNQPSKGTVPIGGTVRTLTSGVVASYPSCTVTVFLTGTLTPATIYSDNIGTLMANPFTANTDGSFLFFAATGGYDVIASAAGMPAPRTWTGIQLGGGTSSGGGPQLSTNGVLNGSQTLLNLANGANVSIIDNGTGTDTISVTGVITGATPNSGLTQTGSTLGFQVCPNGQILKSTGSNWTCSAFLSGPVLQTNSVNNGLQNLLNLIAGAGMAITDNGSGGITFAATSSISPASQFAMPYYSAAGTGSTISGVASPTSPDGVPQLFMSTPASGLATVGHYGVPGVALDQQTGTSYSIPIADNLHFVTGNNGSATAWAGFALANNYAFSFMNLGAGLITYTPNSGTVNGNATQIIPQNWFGFHYTTNTNTIMPLMPTIGAFPNCTSALTFLAATGVLGCNSSVGTGSVTSVGLTVNGTSPSGIFTISGSPVTTTGTLNFNLAGTSGGVPYFSSSTVLSAGGILNTNVLTKGAGSGAAPTNSSVTDDGTAPTRTPNGSNVATSGGSAEYVNDTVTGTVVNKLACDNGSGKAILCAHTTSTTNIPLGVVISGAGTSGSSVICSIFFCSVISDNQTTAKHWLISSSTVDGDVHDTGATTETAGQPNLYNYSANAGVGTATVIRLYTPDSQAATTSCPTCLTAAAALTSGNVVKAAASNRTTSDSGIAAANLVTASSPGAGVAHFAGSTQVVTSSAVVGADMTNNTVTATQLAAQYSKGSCTEVWGGSGTANAMASGDDAIVNNSCYNDSAVTRTITAVKCRSDNAANTTVLTPTFGSAGTGTAILTGTVTCGNSYAYSATGTLTNTAWTTGTGIDPGMSTVGNATSIALIVEFTY